MSTLELPGQLPSTWLGALTADAGSLDPQLYNALATYESVLDSVIGFTGESVPTLLAFITELYEQDEQSLQDIALHTELPRLARALNLRALSLADLTRTLNQSRAQVLRLLPAEPGTIPSATPAWAASQG